MPTNLYQMFGADRNMETGDGIDLRYGDDVVFRVRRAGGSNNKYQNELRKLLRPPRQRPLDVETMDAGEFSKLMMKAFARGVVIGWENVTDPLGNQIPFNEKNFIDLMSDLPDLWTAILEQCNKASNFRADQIAEDAATIGNFYVGPTNGVE